MTYQCNGNFNEGKMLKTIDPSFSDQQDFNVSA